MRLKWRSPLSSTTVLFVNILLFALHLVLYRTAPDTNGQVSKTKGSNVDCPPVENLRPQLEGADGDVWVDNWDGMHEAVMGVPGIHWTNRRIFLIRHGQYKSEGPEQGHLSSIGIKQAHLVAKRLHAMNMTFDRFIASTSIRAQETAQIVQQYFPRLVMESSELLKEGKPTFPQPPIKTWDPYDEEFERDGSRIEEGFRTYLHRPLSTQPHTTNEIIVAHGNVISYFTLRALQVPPVRWVQLSIMQGSLTMMELSTNGHVVVRLIGDVGHIPKHMWTG